MNKTSPVFTNLPTEESFIDTTNYNGFTLKVVSLYSYPYGDQWINLTDGQRTYGFVLQGKALQQRQLLKQGTSIKITNYTNDLIYDLEILNLAPQFKQKQKIPLAPRDTNQMGCNMENYFEVSCKICGQKTSFQEMMNHVQLHNQQNIAI